MHDGYGLILLMIYIYDLHNLLLDFVYHQGYEIFEILTEMVFHGMGGEIALLQIQIDGMHLLLMIHEIQILIYDKLDF
jgi:hypothetical protein